MKTQNSIYILGAIFLAISLLLVVFLIWPAVQKIQQSSAEIFSDRVAIASLGKDVGALDNFKKQYDIYKPNLAKVDQLFIDAQNPVSFIEFLEKIAKDSNLEIDVRLFDGKDAIKAMPAAVFSIVAKGDFLNIVSFAQKMENGPYLINITNMTIAKSIQPNVIEKKAPIAKAEAHFLISVATK